MVDGIKSAVVLWANFFSLGASDQQNVLVHELLHAYTRWNDPAIYEAFANKGLTDTGSSNDISNWIGTDCHSTPVKNP